MKKRSPLYVATLTLITVGIYGIYWLYITRKELVLRLQNNRAIPSFWLLFAPLIILLLALPIGTIAKGPAANVLLIGVAMLAIVAMLIIGLVWFWRYCFTVHTVVQDTDAGVLYLFWIVLCFLGLGFIWPALIQGQLNKCIDRANGGGNGGQPVTASTPYPQYPPVAPTPPQAPMPGVPQPPAPGYMPPTQQPPVPPQPPMPPNPFR